jgi:Tfp pilus assembly protein PilF
MAVRAATPHATPEIAKLAQKLAKDPTSKVFVQLAEEYVKAGLFPEAIAALEEGLQVYPTFVTARVALGRVYHQIGEAAKARKALEEAVKHSPDNLLAHRMLARLYADAGEVEPALQSCAVVLGANPKDGEIIELRRRIEQKKAPAAAGDNSSDAALSPQAAQPQSRAPDPRARTVEKLRALLTTVKKRRGTPAARRSE